MSNDRQRITTRTERAKWGNRSSSSAITSTPSTDGATSNGKRRWLILGAVLLVLGAGWAWYLVSEWQHAPALAEGKKRPSAPITKRSTPTEEDKLVERFIDSNKAGDEKASALLADLPTGEGPITEEEFERRAAGLFLRDRELKVIDYALGEVDSTGRVRESSRYTLITRGNTRTPHFQVKEPNGKVSSTSLSMFNPDIVVEVRGGKIHPVRTEAHRDR